MPMPEHMMATLGWSPVRMGTSTVEPNIDIMCWMPRGIACATGTWSETPITSLCLAIPLLS